MPSQTSSYGASLPVEGFSLGVLVSSTTETIANGSDFSMPIKADTVDNTNFGMLWHSRIPTLLDMGKIALKIFWQPKDATHSAATGLRFLLINKILTTFTATYPDGSVDTFPAYVTGFGVTGKVGGQFEGALELSNSGAPTLC